MLENMKRQIKQIVMGILEGLLFIFSAISVIVTLIPIINPIQYTYGLLNFGLSLWLHFTVTGAISTILLIAAFYINKKNSNKVASTDG
jgi:uncharacterized membrane protein